MMATKRKKKKVALMEEKGVWESRESPEIN